MLPPTEAYPDGQNVPYLYKVNIPHYGTAYATVRAPESCGAALPSELPSL